MGETETFWLNLNWSLETGGGNEVREEEVKGWEAKLHSAPALLRFLLLLFTLPQRKERGGPCLMRNGVSAAPALIYAGVSEKSNLPSFGCLQCRVSVLITFKERG